MVNFDAVDNALNATENCCGSCIVYARKSGLTTSENSNVAEWAKAATEKLGSLVTPARVYQYLGYFYPELFTV